MTPNYNTNNKNTVYKITEEFLEEYINKNTSSDFVLKNDKTTDNEKLIKNVNNKVLLNVLSPEISNNESVKRVHKAILLGMLALFLIGQFFAVFKFTSITLNFSFQPNANIEVVKALLTFISAYITSVIIELIAILRYIVKNVFDTSIAELIKIFKEDTNNLSNNMGDTE